VKLRGLFSLPALAIVALISVAQPSSASPLLSLGNPGSFAILGYRAPSELYRAAAPLAMSGGIAVGQNGIAVIGGSGLLVSGQVVTTTALMGSPPGTRSIDDNTCSSESTCTANSSAVKNTARASSAQTAIQNLYSIAAGLVPTPNQTVSSLAGPNLNLGSNYNYVLDVADSTSVSAGRTFTVNDDNTDYVVTDIEGGGGLAGSAGGAVKLKGISPDHFLFNLICTRTGRACTSISDAGSNDISFSGSFAGAGIILAPDRNITEDTPSGSWTGRLFSDNNSAIPFFPDAGLVEPQAVDVTAPPYLALFAVVVAVFGLYFSCGAGLRRVLAQRKKPVA
jgi:hypothetical protein